MIGMASHLAPAAVEPIPGAIGAAARAWRDGPLVCAGGGLATLFLDRHGYVVGIGSPGVVPFGWHLSEIYTPESAASGDAKADLRAAARIGSVDLEGWWDRSAQSRCWVEATLTALRGVQGALTGFALVVRDATAARQAAEALRLSEARLAEIVGFAREAIVSTDDSHTIVLFNPAAERVFGYPAGDVLGLPLRTLLADAYQEFHAGQVLTLVGRGENTRREGDLGEVAARRRDGSVFPAVASRSSVEVAGQRLCTWFFRDLTLEKRSAAEAVFLLRAETELRGSLDPGAVVSTIARLAVESLGGHCFVFVPRSESRSRWLAGASSSPAVQGIFDRLEAEDFDVAGIEPLASTLRSGDERRLPFADGTVFAAGGWPPESAEVMDRLSPGALVSIPLSVQRRPVGVLTLIVDGAEGLSGDQARLAREFAGRAAVALEMALMYEEVCRAVRMRDELMSIVSHDLRNPLSAILMITAVLAEEDGATRLEKPLRMISRSAEHMRRIVNDLLDVAALDTGRLSIQLGPVAPAAVLAEAAQTFGPMAEQAGIVLETGTAGDLPALWADPDRLQQVLSNLVSNAIRFTPPGGRIVLTGERETEGAGVRFTVRDTGTGISPEQLPRVFDRFWQASRTGRRNLGLGLAIVRGIVEGHGGRVWVESEPGRGTALHFSVPCGAAAPECTPEGEAS